MVRGETPRVGFIGLGKQGKPLAANALAAGYALTVFDKNPAPVKELCEAGAGSAASAREAAAQSDIVQICVADDAQLEAVLAGEDGVVAAVRPRQIVVVHSTVAPATIVRWAARIEEKDAQLVDAPVSGGERGALARTMSYMVGGSEDALSVCRPLFETSGHAITHCGGVGMGMRAKLVHQIVIAINRLAAYEGMTVGLKAGLSKEVLQRILHDGGAQSKVADNWFARSSRPFAIPLYYKDLDLALALAHELEMPLPGAALAQQSLDDIIP